MKKITLFLFLLSSIAITSVQAQITTFPYTEDFESGDGGWVADNTTNGTWALGTPTGAIINSAASGTNAWVTNLSGNYNTNEDSWVTSPVFDFSSLSAPSIELSIWYDIEFSWDGAVLQSSIDGGTTWVNVGANGDPNNWYTDDTIGGNPGGQQEGWSGTGAAGTNAWVTARHALTGLGGQSNVIFRIAFGSDGSVVDEGFGFDDINIFEVTCPEPSDLAIVSTGSDSATLSWTENGTATSWNIEVVLDGGIQTETPTDVANTNPFTITGLTPASNYVYYIQADCGGDVSSWVGPFAFSTECVTFTAPYTEGFENGGTIPLCWTMDGGEDWQFSDTGAGNHIGDNGTITGTTSSNNFFAWVDSSGNDGVTTLTSPLVDVSGLTNPSLSFYELSDNEGNANSQLDVEVWDGAAWNNMGTYNTNTAGWELKLIDLSSLVITGDVQVRFIFSEPVTGDFYDDIAIDDVTLDEAPTCFDPTFLTASAITSTSAELGWTQGGTVVDWNIELVPAGTPPTGTATDSGVTNPYTVSGLTAVTDYEYYVQANCGSELSGWVGPFAFTTECTTFTAPYTEGFENGGTIPLCWTMDGGEDWFFDNDPGFNHIGDNGTITGTTATNDYFAWCDSSGDDGVRTLTSPLVDVSGLTSPALSFYEISDNEGNANCQLDVEVWDGAAWNNMGTYNTNTSGWELKIIGLSSLTITGDVQARFIFSEIVTGDFYDDIAIDDVTFDEAPDCIPPSSITITNITGSSADIDWIGTGGEGSWEYVVVPAGTGEPTGPGTEVFSPSVNETGLSFSSSYEVWVRANCDANGFSEWVGPVVFDTPIQTDFTLDCANDGPLTIDYCYDNGGATNPLIFTFTSNDGTPLNLVFNSGFVENNWDELVVLDSDGNPFPGYAPADDNYGNGGNIGGLSFQSTGDTISFYINSDGSVSCGSGSATYADGINYTVSCATCINPEATYTVIDDCENGDQFLIDVDITSLGDATNLTISNNINSDTVPVTAVGVYQVGPFPFLQDVIVSVSNDDDVNCIINSQAIQLLACPPDNDNCDGATVASVNTDESCSVTTPGTILAATPSGVPLSCGGDPDDDVWFQFTAAGDQQIIDIQNITGGTTNLDHALYGGDCGNLVEIYCSDDTFSLTPSLVVGDTYYIRVFSASSASETSTFDLCISTLGTPTYCLDALPICADPSIQYESIVGDQTAPPYLDYDCLGSQPDPQWNTINFDVAGDYVFSLDQVDLSGNPIDIDFIVWGPFVDQQGGCVDLLPESIADCSYSATASETITLTNVPANSVYVILITNFSQDPGFYTFTQDSGPPDGTNCDVVCDVVLSIEGGEVEDDIEDPITPDETFEFCGYPSVELTASTFYSVDEFRWYRDGFIIADYNQPNLTVTESGTYQVQVLGGICDQSETYFSALIDVRLFDEAPSVDPQNITVCDGPGSDGVEDFDLDALTASLDLGEDFVVSYYTNINDANQAINAVSSPYTSSGETLIIRIEDATAASEGFLGCRQLSEVELVVNPRPVVNQPENFVVCDDSDGNVDGSTEFDLTSIDDEVSASSDVTITYHSSQADADNSTGALTSPYTSSGETVFVRVEDINTGCYETTSFDLVVNIVPLATFDQQFEYIVCPNATVPVSIGIIPDNFTATDVSVTWSLDGVDIPGASGLTLDTVLVSGDYSAEIVFNDTQCSNTVTAFVEEAESCVFPEGISPNNDDLNDTFDLSSFDVVKLEIFNRNGTLVYSKNNYVDEWEGQTNDGEELPVGTYFYTVIYEGGAKQKSAWVYINR
ncbi:T9SS type B sorting domain-containing protein [Winogradskyella poriferorum]|uniref:Gliding motility-associated C-terminal domain-containing protein n=1 Tax=Winogradskyella poriferorum TaxID=307627 RepID=A0ABU7W2D4_9FLAO